MKNADMSIVPVVTSKSIGTISASKCESQGMTKREMFAISLMAAMISSPPDKFNINNPSDMARCAITSADALLAELEKQQ